MKWNEDSLGSICEANAGIIQTGPFGSQLHQSDYADEGVPVVMPQDIVDGRIDLNTVVKVTEDTANKLKRHKLKLGALVMPRRGEINKRAFITKDQEGFLCGTGCIKIELSGEILDSRFLYYYMKQPQVVSWIEQNAVGTTMLNLNTNIIERIPIRYPHIDAQKAIAEAMTAYDDLIENNLRRMALLEESARLLYKEWFVHLRFPGHEHTRIIDGVPEGWEKKPLSSVAEINRQSIGSSFDGEIEYIDIASVTPGHINETIVYDFADAPSRARRVVQHGNIIWSCVRPNRRSHALILQPPSNLIVSTGFAVITPTRLPTSFLYFATTTDAFVGYLENHAKGAAYPAVLTRDFEQGEILNPPPRLADAFNKFVEPSLAQIHNLRVQNQKLKAARNLLLPRLMNGEIEV